MKKKKNSNKKKDLSSIIKELQGYFWLILVVLVVVFGLYTIQGQLPDQALGGDDLVLEDDEPRFECSVRRNLDGVCAEDVETGVYAVMIDRQHEAGSAAGVNQASLVYEAIVEYPVTRWLVFFSSDVEVPVIGPVRSARPYYVNWAQEFNGVYAHVGGSNEALELIKSTDLVDMNQFSKGPYFWRSTKRNAPHNVFTSTELINKSIEDYKWDVPVNYDYWMFKSQSPADSDHEQTINVDYKNSVYNVSWVYNQEDNNYFRKQGGSFESDFDGVQVSTKNLVVMYTDGEVIDDYGRRSTRTLGTGDAVVFQDGQAIESTWRRSSLSTRTRFYDKFQNEIGFNPGRTWINVVPTHFPLAQY